MGIRLVVARGCRPTGEILEGLLREQGVELTSTRPQGIVSYGVRIQTELPGLNCSGGARDKYEELEILARAGVRVPWHSRDRDWLRVQQHAPVLGRRLHHVGGRDLRLIRTRIGWDKWSPKRDFFTQFIDNDREFRVWVYRGRHLGTYEKVLRHPEWKSRMVGRNYGNGYAFELCPEANIPRDAVQLGKEAIAAMGLDFGAADIIRGKDGTFYVLEVNTAPGVEGPGRQVIRSLAEHIAKWVKKGFPKRKEEK